ncbi:bsr3760 [Bradyrhizobium diazoefficiens USDA 110]|jgi:hypothetical protein|uniref:Bsr3760 protein n=2 Tax=Bradyrhizobium diazoefficiens TaxID=1355477 RepID=Q89NS4_BRADU|nr:hypothetical protein CO678_18590 [Bradyrhizobium diazoefficiens]QBP22531.1 hypothetical protein Bdiaspc4_19405 [Bradyrhizobium diazoefficiens]QHP71187.1 hypothetical protein EI171_30165 [Bradyrhizobium sp. LCT2]BAC49025.1 bsr3760 [Bradyrhizobium diazoefficiens USDA 110]
MPAQQTVKPIPSNAGPNDMDKDKSGRIVETALEARQGELGPSVLMLLGVSMGLAILIMAVTGMMFFSA